MQFRHTRFRVLDCGSSFGSNILPQSSQTQKGASRPGSSLNLMARTRGRPNDAYSTTSSCPGIRSFPPPPRKRNFILVWPACGTVPVVPVVKYSTVRTGSCRKETSIMRFTSREADGHKPSNDFSVPVPLRHIRMCGSPQKWSDWSPPSEAKQLSPQTPILDRPLSFLPRTKPLPSKRPTGTLEASSHRMRLTRGSSEAHDTTSQSPSVEIAESYLAHLRVQQNHMGKARCYAGGRNAGDTMLTGGALHVLERSPMSIMMWAPVVTGESRQQMNNRTVLSQRVQEQLRRHGGGIEMIPTPVAACRPYYPKSTSSPRNAGCQGWQYSARGNR